MLIVFMYIQLVQAIFSAVQAMLMTLELCWCRRSADQDGCAEVASASACQTPPHPLWSVAGHVAVVVVKELVEHRMVGLNLSLRRTTEEAISLGEVNRVVEHVQLREWSDTGLGHPVRMDISHRGTPGVQIGCRPVLGVKQRMVHFHQPAGEDGVSGSGLSGGTSCCRSCK